MTSIRYNPGHKEVLDTLLLRLPGVKQRKMFGYPAYYVDNRLFACLYEEGVGLKVPADIAESLVGREGIVRFQPLGRKPMKEWIQINRARSEDYAGDLEIFRISMAFTAST